MYSGVSLMDIQYRPALEQDLPECVELFQESVADLRVRHNMPPGPVRTTDRMLAFYRHAHRTEIFHVAEAEGRIAALACAILRDRTWFLSGFWARPALQRQHIGMPLLRGVWRAGKEAGAKLFFVWASKELTAMAAYMKLGMLPGSQLLAFEGEPKLSEDDTSACSVQPLDKTFAMDLDRVTLGMRREVDHDYLRSVRTARLAGATRRQEHRVLLRGRHQHRAGGVAGDRARRGAIDAGLPRGSLFDWRRNRA